MFTLQDARREKIEADARAQISEKQSQIRFLIRCHNLAIRKGWDAMAARYDARIHALRNT